MIYDRPVQIHTGLLRKNSKNLGINFIDFEGNESNKYCV